MDLVYISPKHVHGVENASLESSLYVYREALEAIRHVSTPMVLEMRMQLAQAIEQLQNELAIRDGSMDMPARTAA